MAEFKQLRRVTRAAAKFNHAATEWIAWDELENPARVHAQRFWEIALELGIDLGDTTEPGVFYELMTPLFGSWLIYSFRPLVAQEGSKRRRRREAAATILLQQAGKRLDPLQVRYAQAAMTSPLSFWIAEQDALGTLLELRNLFTDERVRAFDPLLSRELRRGEIIFSRIVTLDECSFVEGCGGLRIPPTYLHRILDLKDQILASEGSFTLAQADRQLNQFVRLYFEICADIIDPRMPVIRNTDGHSIVPIELKFDLYLPIEEAFEKLKTLALDVDSLADLANNEIQRAPDGSIRELIVTWAKRGNAVHASWPNTTLGHIRVSRGSLRVDVNSRERAQSLRDQIETRLGPGVRHRESVVHGIERALEASGTFETPELQHCEQFDAMRRDMRRQNTESWLDRKLPALGNLTPHEAMREPHARERLEALLIEFEWRNRQTASSGAGFDLDLLRERLGLGHG